MLMLCYDMLCYDMLSYSTVRRFHAHPTIKFKMVRVMYSAKSNVKQTIRAVHR